MHTPLGLYIQLPSWNALCLQTGLFLTADRCILGVLGIHRDNKIGLISELSDVDQGRVNYGGIIY